jgi:Fe(3+) dicitrate transport protein
MGYVPPVVPTTFALYLINLNKDMRKSLSTLIIILGFSFTAYTQTEVPGSKDSIIMFFDMPSVQIVGTKPGLLTDLPGSVSRVEQKTLQSIQPLQGNEIFRTISGVNVVDEEGLGMRMNIGIRGLDPDRSSRVLVLEDGIPVALNPYGEPQMYYTPVMDRMTGVDVLKGSGQILFGPQTIGGVVNFKTADPPEEFAGKVDLRGGEGGFRSALIQAGNTFGNIGLVATFLHKAGDQVGITAFAQNDLSLKMKARLTPSATLGLKLGYYDELSNATYIGLTQTMYDAGDSYFVHMAPDDRLNVQRISGSLFFQQNLQNNWKVEVNAFGYTTTRNWQRQDFGFSPGDNDTGVIWGDTTVQGGAVYMRNSNGHRNRQFAVAGIEPKISGFLNFWGRQHLFKAGLRYLDETAFEQRINGDKADAKAGDLVNDEKRKGRAYSAYTHQVVDISDKFSLSGGLRFESYTYQRDIHRSSSLDTFITSSNTIHQVIPGVGFNINPKESLTIFGGIHRGFAPPRIKDAITAAGEVYEVDPELSWNTELGFRSRPAKFMELNLTGFYINFSNQVIPVSESSGGTGFGLVNGGSTIHAGIEVETTFELLRQDGYLLDLLLNGTFVHAVYNSDRFLSSGGEQVNINGNRTPYAPEWFGTASLVFESPFGLKARFTGNYTGQQFADELNTLTASPNGRIGLIEAYWIVDGTLSYTIEKWNTDINLAVKNITDERFIVSRRPQGIRVGLPRYVSGGFTFNF